MSYTLAGAATATGQSKKAILRAIRDGKIAGTKDALGNWSIEAAELHGVFPHVAAQGGGDGADALPRYSEEEVEALGAQIEALLRQAGARLRQQLDEVRRERDTEQDQNLVLADQHDRR